jgi:hypothetical protein
MKQQKTSSSYHTQLMSTALLRLPRVALASFYSALMLLVLLASAGQAQPMQVKQTDSSRIETQQYPGGREVKEILRQKDRVYWRFYRENGAQVTTTAMFNKDGRTIGLWTEYDDHGKVRYVIDCDQGTWRVAQLKAYPFFALQRRMKARADSLLVTTYGRQFVQQYTVWNIQGSAIYNGQESGNWTDQLAAPPNRFLFRYDVKLDAQHVYPKLIQFALDARGQLVPDSVTNAFGLERRLPWSAKRFALRYEAALQLATSRSGARRQSLTGFLQWDGLRQANSYGHFRFYIPVPTGSDKDLHPAGRSEITTHFDVYIFDPWTGALLAQKKMQTNYGWEANSSSSSGLQPE